MTLLSTGLLSTLFSAAADAQAGPKVLLIYDMEGITDAVQPTDVSYGSPTYEATRESLVEDVNAAIRGLLAAGASEVVLTDAHGSGNPDPDYILGRMPDGARFDLRDEPYDAYIDTMDDSFDAVVAIAMHSKAGGGGFLAHTYYGHTRWVMAGYDMNESMLVAASAARFDIPLILVTGDDVLRNEIEAFSPETEYVVVKTAISVSEAKARPRAQVSAEIEAAAERGLRNLRNIPAWKPREMRGGFENLYGYTDPMHAASAVNFPGARAVDNKTIALTTSNFMEAYLAYRALCNFTAAATLRSLLTAVRDVDGGREILRRAQATLPNRGERSFEPTGTTIDLGLSARGRHGYRE